MRAVVGAVLLVLSVAVPAHAQRGLGHGLDDPSGRRAPVVRSDGSEAAWGDSATRPARVERAAPLETATATRLRALESSFQTLGARGRDYTSTVLSMVGGGVTIALAAILWELGGPAADLAPYYFVMGGVGVVRPAVVDFALQPDMRSPAIEFQHMPASTDAEVQARLRFGEHALESLAEQSLIARIVDASFNIAGALAVIPAYLIPQDFMIDDPLEAFVFVGPAITLVSAIITLASPSAAEQRWDAYRALRDRLAQ